MTSVLSIALGGMTAATGRAATAARDIAASGTKPIDPAALETQNSADASPDLAQSMIELDQARTAYRANAAVARVASEMDRELIDRFDQTV